MLNAGYSLKAHEHTVYACDLKNNNGGIGKIFHFKRFSLFLRNNFCFFFAENHQRNIVYL